MTQLLLLRELSEVGSTVFNTQFASNNNKNNKVFRNDITDIQIIKICSG